MAFYTLADRAISTVETTLTDSANHVHVKTADYALFPATGTYPITICLLTSGVESNVERCLCTSKTGPDILNITRAQFGTSAAEHAVGELVQLRVTEGVLSQFQGQSATINVYASDALNKPQETVAGMHYVCATAAGNDVEINAAIDALTVGRTKKEIVKLIGTFYLQNPISMPDYTILDLRSATLKAAETTHYLAGPFIRNDDWTTLGNAACEIWGGLLIGSASQTKGTWDDTTPDTNFAAAIVWFQPSAGVPAPITAHAGIPGLKIDGLSAHDMKAGGIYYRGHGGDSGGIYAHDCQLYGLSGSDYTAYLYDICDSKVESSGGWMTAGGLRLITNQGCMFNDNYWGGGNNGIYMTGTSRWNIFNNQRLDNCNQHFLLIDTWGANAPHYNSFYNTHFRFLTAAPNNTYDLIHITAGGSTLNAAYNLFDGITYDKADSYGARYIVFEGGTAAYVHNNSYFNIQGDAAETATLSTVSTTCEVMNHYGGVDDAAVDGATTAPISSNWAYDHGIATTGVHGVGAGTIAKTADITATKLDDFATPDANTDLNANTTNHGLLLQATAPASTLLNVVGIVNGETAYTNKAMFDATHPEDIGTAAEGSQIIAARRDHVHAIAANTVSLAMMANLVQDKIIGRATASTGVPEAIDCTAAGRALLDDANATAQLATLGCGTMALATATDYITFAKATTITAHGACTGWDDPAGTCTFAFTTAWKHSATVDEAVTMVFTDPGVGATLHLILTKDASETARTITYPVSGISWIGTALTSLTTNAGKYVVVLLRTAADTYIAQGSEAV